MADIVDRETRRRMMSGIRSKDTTPEVRVRSLLHRQGFRFRLTGRRLFGRPDIVLPKWKSVVFVHGCFWHRHPGCKFSYMPSSNVPFWLNKFDKNVARDKKVKRQLRSAGWHVFVIWGCEITESRIGRLAREIRSKSE